MQFVVIVNPNSGPGVDPEGWLPDKHYSREVPRLTAYGNVKIVGYVRVDYCRRSVSEVSEDIKKYANWSGTASRNSVGTRQPESAPTGSTQFAVHGIFFDEVPNVWEVEHAAYLEDIGILVKEVDGIVGDRLVSCLMTSMVRGVKSLLTSAGISQLWNCTRLRVCNVLAWHIQEPQDHKIS